jgi:steroid delta-isomerase-like uncharacterized protein
MQPTETLIRDYYAAFNRGDWDAMCTLLAPDVAHDINQGGRETGVAAFRAFLARMASCYREELRDITVMVDATGTRAAAEFTVHGTYLVADEGLPPARGQSYQLPAGAFFQLRDGLIARVTMYYNLNDWLAQVAP